MHLPGCQKNGAFHIGIQKNRAIHILFVEKRGPIIYLTALKKGPIRHAHPYYAIYRKLPPPPPPHTHTHPEVPNILFFFLPLAFVILTSLRGPYPHKNVTELFSSICFLQNVLTIRSALTVSSIVTALPIIQQILGSHVTHIPENVDVCRHGKVQGAVKMLMNAVLDHIIVTS